MCLRPGIIIFLGIIFLLVGVKRRNQSKVDGKMPYEPPDGNQRLAGHGHGATSVM